MKSSLKLIRDTLKLINRLEEKHKIVPNSDNDEPLLYCGVIKSDNIPNIESEVEFFFGKPYKSAGEGAMLKNFFDKFVKEVGGARKEQTLYRKDINPQVCMYCAFWPWGSRPVSTSVRIGLVCFGADERAAYTKELDGEF